MPRITRLLTALLALVGTFGCVSIPEDTPPVPVTARGPVRIACVGDSITFGSGLANRPLESYPSVLGRLLGDTYFVSNFGVSGATMLRRGDKPYWQEERFRAVRDFNPSIVLLKLGTNDSKPQNWQYGYEFENDYAAMVEYFRALPSRPIVVPITPVPVFDDRWGINDQAVSQVIAPSIRGVAARLGLPTIDLNAEMRNNSTMFPDGVHPNAVGADLIARKAHRVIRAFRR